MNFFKIILYPFSLLYDASTRLRNHLYNIEYKPAFHFETIVISVGNLSVGGTGKTPMIEFLIRLLKGRYKLATLSRGYGRKSKGFKIAASEDNAESIGDEPYQFYSKFQSEILVAVGEERAIAIPEILYNQEDIEVILLDDAYQHRKVERDLNILLTTFERPFFDDLLLPAGRLREAASGAKRADVIVVTKCPREIYEQQKLNYKTRIEKYARPNTPVFFSSIGYEAPQPVFGNKFLSPKGTGIIVSGLANASDFEAHARNCFAIANHLKFNDHHDYTLKDIQQIKAGFEALEQGDKFVLTTEKDMVKFLKPELKSVLEDLPVFYLPITIQILTQQAEFEHLVINSIKKRKDTLAGII